MFFCSSQLLSTHFDSVIYASRGEVQRSKKHERQDTAYRGGTTTTHVEPFLAAPNMAWSICYTLRSDSHCDADIVHYLDS